MSVQRFDELIVPPADQPGLPPKPSSVSGARVTFADENGSASIHPAQAKQSL